jgi:hypothetical protein
MEENSRNEAGRQSNRGPEGLAITPAGDRLIAAMQGPLLQDAERLPDGKLRGNFVRLLSIDLHDHSVQAFVYPLEDSSAGISEILAVNEDEFLVLERDSTVGNEAKIKKITRIHLAGATDVMGIARLPHCTLPAHIRPVQKTILLDFLDPKFELVGDRFPEKIEGLAFGPKLPDGRLSLIATVDNDFEADQPSMILSFALTPDELPGFAWRR